MKQNISRRKFIKSSSIAATGVALASTGLSAKSYDRVLGANERINFAIVGVRSRAHAHLDSIAAIKNTMVTHVCDVDKRYLDKFASKSKKMFKQEPEKVKDIRKMLESKDIDAFTIATPEHWHAPMAIMGLQAGKNVYVEKPCAHNPVEGEMLVEAQKKYGKVVQMGNQQRSSDHTIKIIKRIHEGLIGDAYMGKAWYSNTREGIGVGKEVPVPDYLDWDLWQGPAPRRKYKDNVHPYNWHWFWHWGTGETLNNGTHEVDICRWALDVGYPNKVSADGGRYHYHDDWEFYDTLITNYQYDNKLISWEGKSCQGMLYFDRGRGATIHGTKGTVLIDREGFIVFDINNKIKEEYTTSNKDGSMDTVGGGSMTTAHFQNFINAIKLGEKQNSPINEGNISCTMLLLSNIAWKLDRALHLDPVTGHVKDDKKATEMCGREYEKGWELKI